MRSDEDVDFFSKFLKKKKLAFRQNPAVKMSNTAENISNYNHNNSNNNNHNNSNNNNHNHNNSNNNNHNNNDDNNNNNNNKNSLKRQQQQQQPHDYHDNDINNDNNNINNNNSNNIKYCGYIVDLVEKICGILQLKFNIDNPTDGEYGQQRFDGSWSGLVGELVERVSELKNE
ncbi:hypothetical protein HELRODRAFT_177009 [Helobdella robusta]|uniref:Ionotropic glutamate receptor L-glutamate and glycine-binding domain-containing protein n=1 Tax=Helobdella robusta TaxID=6412 RepID=T1FB49_HELRO|nr:hypothetical protein HELRODRAFT_177009 [Helobdella robusta]ESN98529.1 hypothetical protein HELRODRAFT_177009 [Helobdella robusta]